MKFLKSLFASSDVFRLNSESAKSFTECWPQINFFYEILVKTFDAGVRGNMELIKSNSGILLEKAEELSIEGMPAAYRNPKTLEMLLTLKKQTQFVDELVQKNAADTEIKTALTKLYEIFHLIVELCLSKK